MGRVRPIQASLNTVLAAVEERTARQASGAMEAGVGRAPTTVEDCLQASGFGAVRKVAPHQETPTVNQRSPHCTHHALSITFGICGADPTSGHYF